MRLFCVILTSVGLLLGANGCALRATTDFGPQSASTKQSVNGGLDGAPGVSLFGGGGTHGSVDGGGAEAGGGH